MGLKEELRKSFPILGRKVNNRPLVYLDNAATTQKPAEVIDRISRYYREENSNIHRGAHFLSNMATEAYEKARNSIQSFINAGSPAEIIFTRGTTESINLVAHSFAEKYLKKGDEVVISEMEHHSNIVPWQIVCERHKARLRIIPLTASGELDLDEFGNMLGKKTKIIAVTHVSNALGTVNPVREITGIAHKLDIPVLIDGAQATPHMKVDVREIDCDFYCFSGHKMYGPMGTGVLYGKEEWLREMPPYQSGGEMIKEVSFEKTTFNELPFKFEAGTPNVADVLGLEAAATFITELGYKEIASHEDALLEYAKEKLAGIDKLRLIASPREQSSVISFIFEDIHPYDTGILLDKMGIAVRTGHHCAQPLMDHLGVPGTVRASFAIYNTMEEADILVNALIKIREMLA